MKAWCKFIKHIKKQDAKGEYLFENLRSKNCNYNCSDIYLGVAGEVFLCNMKTEIDFSFSVKEGTLVKIKQNQPYKILFDYVDGAFYVNDDRNINYNKLSEDLSALKNDTHISEYETIYTKPEEIIYNFIVDEMKI